MAAAASASIAANRPAQLTPSAPVWSLATTRSVFEHRAVVVLHHYQGYQLTEIAEKRVKQELETVKDVGSVGYNGDRKREIQLLLNADRLNAYELLECEAVVMTSSSRLTYQK